MSNYIVLFVVVAVVAAALSIAGKTRPARRGKPHAKKLLTDREQAMHHRLTQSLPDMVVLAQVSFGALLGSRHRAVRNTFDRKMADFVVCDKAFRVMAVIELDDSSHRNRAAQDGARDALLIAAGYRVLRYSNIPDIAEVRKAFRPVTASVSMEAGTRADSVR